MQLVRLVLAGVMLAVILTGTAGANGCTACFFGGTCDVGGDLVECRPTQAGCAPNGGILVFNSVPPNVPAYWTLYANRRRAPGSLAGKLKVFGDEEPGDPAVPGFPGRCEHGLCFGRTGRFSGTVVGDELTAVARYRRGGECEFHGTIRFGFGGDVPNTFTCRSKTGDVTSSGTFHLQGIRLRGCGQ